MDRDQEPVGNVGQRGREKVFLHCLIDGLCGPPPGDAAKKDGDSRDYFLQTRFWDPLRLLIRGRLPLLLKGSHLRHNGRFHFIGRGRLLRDGRQS